MPANNNNVSLSFSGDPSELLSTIERLNQAITQLKSNASSISFGGKSTSSGAAASAGASARTAAPGTPPPSPGLRLPRLDPIWSRASGLASAMNAGTATAGQASEFVNLVQQAQGFRAAGSELAAAQASGIPVTRSQLMAGINASSPAQDPQGFLRQAAAFGLRGSAYGGLVNQVINGGVGAAPGIGQSVLSAMSTAANSPPLPTVYPSAFGGPGSNLPQGWAAQQGLIARGAIAGLGTSFATGAANLYASNTVSGEMNPMQAASLYGSSLGAVFGGIAGALLTPTAPGAGMATGGLFGSQIGGATASALMAPYMRQRSTELQLQSIAAREGVPLGLLAGARTGYLRATITPGDLRAGVRFDTAGATRIAGQLGEVSDQVTYGDKSMMARAAIHLGLYTGTDVLSQQQAAETYSTLGSALLSSGEDPSGALDMTRRLGRRYGVGAPAMAARGAAALSARNRLGGNATDLLLQAGPEGFGAMQDALGQADLTPRERLAYRDTQRAGYAAQLASARIRGSGAASVSAIRTELSSLSGLPGGGDSLAYAEGRQRLAGAENQAFSQTQLQQYGLREIGLSGQRERARLEPFSPGSIFALDLRLMAVNTQALAAETSEVRRRRREGTLSVEQEAAYQSDIQRRLTQNAGMRAELSEGMENRLPALMAGGSATFGRYDSSQLAALNLARVGSPIRAYGAVNGMQSAQQTQFASSFGVGGVDATSQTQGLNALTTTLNRVAEALDRLSQYQRQNTGGYPQEASGRMSGALDQSNFRMEMRRWGN